MLSTGLFFMAIDIQSSAPPWTVKLTFTCFSLTSKRGLYIFWPQSAFQWWPAFQKA